MNFREYQDKARSTAIYPAAFRVIYPSLGLSGETGELSELVKKWLRDEKLKPSPMRNPPMSIERKLKIHDELGDVLWYVSNFASDMGFDLDEIAIDNTLKLERRAKEDKIHGDGSNR